MINHHISQPSLFEKGDWEAIEQAKHDFIEKGIPPSTNPALRSEVALSWERSHAYDVHPFLPLFGPDPSPERNETLFSKNRLLMDTAKSMMNESIMQLFAINHFVISLFDRDLSLLCFFCNPGDKSYFSVIANEGFPYTDSGEEYIGSCSQEEVLGTSAPLLALRCSCPVQTSGPENFHDTFSQVTISAAPITDIKGQCKGILALSRVAPKEYWTKEAHTDQANALGWITAMALSISQQIQIKEHHDQLYSANRMLEATLTFIDEGILLVNKNGNILKANRKSLDILGLNENNEHHHNLYEFLKPESQLCHMLSLCANVNNLEDTLITLNGEQNYLFSMRPILGNQPQVTDSMVIRISNLEQIDSYIAQKNSNIAHFTFNDILGESPSIAKAKNMSLRFASSFENILILGESGTGKEIFAQAIHNVSRPRDPFIALNCAAVPRSLVESELFGYEGGSFTGAERKGRKGKIELAQGGTLFLDEIGDMPYEVQAVLLRVLENHQVMRIGSDKYINVEFRLIAATNQDLQELVRNRLFREDLYYRLSALNIVIPPLRSRDNDIILLAKYFIHEYCNRMHWQEPNLSLEAKQLLLNYSWPGNVRQLQKAIIFAATSFQGDSIEPKDFPDDIFQSFSTQNCAEQVSSEVSFSGTNTFKEAEVSTIRKALLCTGNDVTEAAKLLGIGRSTLYKKIKKLNITF